MKESSGEDNKRNRRVEDVFREGFEGAQAPPPARLWDNLDQAMENQELKHYRTQAFWYRSVAAACLLLLLTAGAYLWQQDQSLFGTGEGQLAKAPSANSSQSEANLNAKQGNETTSAAEEATQETSVFDSIPEKQAKNNIASNASPEIATTSLPSGQGDNVQSRPASANNKLASASSKTQRSSTIIASSKIEERTSLTAEATIAQAVEGGIQSNESSSSLVKSSIASESATTTLEPLKVSTSFATITNPTATESLLSSKSTTVLFQGDKHNVQIAKVEVNPTPALPEGKTAAPKGWLVSLAYTPMYAYSPIAIGEAPSREGIRMSEEQQQMYQQYDQALQEYRESYSPAYSYSAKFGAGYQLNNHWQIETGFLYGQHEATTSHSFLITKASNVMRISSAVPVVNRPEPIVKVAFEPELANNLEAVTPTDQFKTRYKYQQIGVPLRVAYHKSISRVFAFVSGGVNLNLLVNSRIKSDNPEVLSKSYHYKDETSPFKAWQWAAATSVGVGYQVNRKMSLTVAPELTYSFSSALKESQTQADPYQVGVSIGGKYRLSK